VRRLRILFRAEARWSPRTMAGCATECATQQSASLRLPHGAVLVLCGFVEHLTANASGRSVFLSHSSSSQNDRSFLYTVGRP